MSTLHLECSEYPMPFVSCLKIPHIFVSFSISYLHSLHLCPSYKNFCLSPSVLPTSARSTFCVECCHHDSLLHITSNINSVAQALIFPIIRSANLNRPKDKSGREQFSHCFFYIPCLFLSESCSLAWYTMPHSLTWPAHILLSQLILSFLIQSILNTSCEFT